MSNPFYYTFSIAESGGDAIVQELRVRVDQYRDKGYDFRRHAGDAWTGSLDYSVSGLEWTQVTALAASGQGTIPDHANWVRLNITVADAIDQNETDGTKLIIAGKEIY